MKNITVSVPDDTYRRARIYCAQNDMSISQYFRYFLRKVAEAYAIERARNLLAKHPEHPESDARSAPAAPLQPSKTRL